MLIYITGGARSGKSRYAQDLAARLAKRVVFVATAFASDDDIKQRIQRHRRDRPKHWSTIENKVNLAEVYQEIDRRTELVLIDCLTMYVAGRLVKGEKEAKIQARVESLCKKAAASKITTILVSNEVGSGIVPMTDWGRRFQDYLGRANQTAARSAEHAIVMVSGIPMVLKGEIA